MTFSNPAGGAAAAATAYVRALLDLLGDREPLEVLPSSCPGSSAHCEASRTRPASARGAGEVVGRPSSSTWPTPR